MGIDQFLINKFRIISIDFEHIINYSKFFFYYNNDILLKNQQINGTLKNLLNFSKEIKECI